MVKSNNKSTPLHFATFYASSSEVILCLIQHYPLALEEVNEYGVTPRTYDLAKLDIRAKEYLMRPTSIWMEWFVQNSIVQTCELKQSLKHKSLLATNLEEELKTTKSDLLETKKSELILSEQLQRLENKLEESKMQTTLLESLSTSIEKSLEESVRLGAAAATIVAQQPHEQPAATPTESNKNLERRIAYLEERLANALESLDTQILKRDTVVDNGWVMTNTDLL